jgi:hypothetical protein
MFLLLNEQKLWNCPVVERQGELGSLGNGRPEQAQVPII